MLLILRNKLMIIVDAMPGLSPDGKHVRPLGETEFINKSVNYLVLILPLAQFLIEHVETLR